MFIATLHRHASSIHRGEASVRIPHSIRINLLAAAIGVVVAVPFNAIASDPTPDPAEPYAVGAPDVALSAPGTSTAEVTPDQGG